ncbi:MAG: pyruvate dehydrogenase complex dihydrolipoamide acetyltransferase [Alphaproteobacteria bacterium]
MPVTIRMPALSPTMTEGKIAQWLKKEGEEVRSGDLLAEIETDKAIMEVEATDEGTLGKILAAAGTEAIAVNAPIAVIVADGEDESALIEAVKAALAEAESAPQQAPAAEAAAPAPAVQPAPAPQAPAPEAARAQPKPAPVSTPARTPGARINASPLARRMAKAEGLDLARITGSGSRGRIVKADVEAAMASVGTGGIFAGLGQSFPAAAARTEPHSMMRKVIAQRLTESKQTVPHYYVTVDCEIDALLDLRSEINGSDEALRVSINDFIIRAVALALGEVPAANASWSDEAMNLYGAADVSVAVATDGGLITPIVRSAEKKGIAAISAEVKDLAARARDGKLAPEEYQGGTFTISNMGMMGVREFAAVINPPQACILAIGAGEERVVVRKRADGDGRDGEIATATLMTCTLSCDHRAVDGTVGAQFLAAFKGLVEHPVRLIL